MPDLRLSVVVVSAGRPRALARCLVALSQMPTTQVEVIVVADTYGLAIASGLPFADRLILLPQDGDNIARARNTGIAAAAGEILGFIDDDAVPEPRWASAVLAGFDQPDICAVTGPVIGRNGISLQWGRMAVDPQGRDTWLKDGEGPVPPDLLKLHGTNMAVRRETLRRTGGFDTGFRFYLDETDLTLRLAVAGGVTRYLPDAAVHHGYAESLRRTAQRVPLDLRDVGASTALFLRKHAPDAIDPALSRLEADQRVRLLRLVRRRKIGARDLRRLMESLVAGIAEGRDRASTVPPVAPADRAFTPLRNRLPQDLVYLGGWLHHAPRLRAAAAAHVAEDRPTVVMLFDPTPRKHRVTFTEGGWWEQRGGLYGPSDRTGPRLQAWRYRERLKAEQARLFRAIPQRLR